MYIPKLFHETRWPEIRRVIEENGFATIVTCDGGVPVATHAPLRLIESPDGSIKLEGHVSVANPQWRLFEQAAHTLAIFTGPHSYISPRWYDHLNVPTWNYIAVHVYGTPRLVGDPAKAREMLRGLVNQYEGSYPGENRYRVEDLPSDFLAGQMKGIVCFEIAIDDIQASFKLSQNRNQASYENVVAELQRSDDARAQKVAEIMAERRCIKSQRLTNCLTKED
ncbi:MAG: FMN-binding negative transcriptional regulator [Candidatus Acidiferrales bacterium]